MSDTARVTLIQQNDTHAQLEPHWEHFWRNGRPDYRRAGGYARAATIVRRIKEETDGSALLVDCGDTIHGTGPAQWTKGAAVVPALNAMGVDLMTPGNWDFGFGPEVLLQRGAEMDFPLIASNVNDAKSGQPLFAPTEVRQIGGIMVGFIGVTLPSIPDTMPAAFSAGLRFASAVEPVQRSVVELRRGAEVDLVVVVSHTGFPQEVQLAKDVQGIDVILSGHTHNRLTAPVQIGRTLMIQSGFSGSFLGRLDLEVRAGHVCAVSHELIEVAASIEEDAATKRVVDEQLEPFRTRLGEVVGQTITGLNRMTVLESTMDNLITDAYLELTGAEVAMSHGWRYGAPIPPGDVTMGDLWQMIPTDPEVFIVPLTGRQIRQRLEASLESVYAPDPFDQKGGFVLRVSGLNAVVRLNNPKGTRVEHLDIAGDPCDPDRSYIVAAAGEQALQDAGPRKRTGTRAVEALRRYVERNSPVNADLTHTKFIAV